MLYLLTVNYHSADLIQRLLRSLDTSADSNWQCLIINNAPDDPTIHTLTSDSVQILETGSNLGFGVGCNVGLQWIYAQDRTAIAWLINPDTVVLPDSLSNAVQFCQSHPDLSIVGTVIREPDGKVWFAGGEFDPNNGKIVATETLPAATTDYLPTAWVTGCSLLLNLAKFSTCPQFDPAYFLYYEDFDFCRRYANQGHAVVITPHVHIIHHPSSITSRNPGLKWQHSTYGYLLALTRHTQPQVVLYRLGRILAHALRKSLVEPQKAIAIIKGVLNYLVRGHAIGSSRHN